MLVFAILPNPKRNIWNIQLEPSPFSAFFSQFLSIPNSGLCVSRSFWLSRIGDCLFFGVSHNPELGIPHFSEFFPIPSSGLIISRSFSLSRIRDGLLLGVYCNPELLLPFFPLLCPILNSFSCSFRHFASS